MNNIKVFLDAIASIHGRTVDVGKTSKQERYDWCYCKTIIIRRSLFAVYEHFRVIINAGVKQSPNIYSTSSSVDLEL